MEWSEIENAALRVGISGDLLLGLAREAAHDSTVVPASLSGRERKQLAALLEWITPEEAKLLIHRSPIQEQANAA